MTLHSEVLEAVSAEPGIGPGTVGSTLGLDKTYVRRFMRKMAARGEIRAEVNGSGYAFYPVNEGGRVRTEEVRIERPAVENARLHLAHDQRVRNLDFDRRDNRADTDKPEIHPVPGYVRSRAGEQDTSIRSISVIRAAPSFDSRLAPSASKALVPAGTMKVHRLDEAPVSGARKSGAMPSPLMQVCDAIFQYDEDGTALAEATRRREQEAIELARVNLANQLENERRAHAIEIERLKAEAERDAITASMGRLIAASQAPAERPKSLLQEAREERARKLAAARAEAAHYAELDREESSRRRMEQFPPEEWPQLYDLPPDGDRGYEAPLQVGHALRMSSEPRSMCELLGSSKEVAPAPPLAASSSAWEWGAALVALGAFVAIVIKWPLNT
jgi:hypothetical protein